MGSVYLTALEQYSGFSFLQSADVEFHPDIDRFVGGLDADGKPVAVLGLSDDVVTPRLRARIIKRFGLPEEDLAIAPAKLFKPFIFAHELGHIVQADPEFRKLFGEMDATVYDPDENYARYVESDHEANADYIAAGIVAHSELGRAVARQAATSMARMGS